MYNLKAVNSRINYVYHIRAPDKAGNRIWNSSKNLGTWRDKAGGYGIQEPFGALAVKEIKGDYYNVVGLPIGRLSRELNKIKGDR